MKGLEMWRAFNKSAKIVVTVLLVFLALSVARSCSSESEIDRWRNYYNDFRENAQTSAQTLSDSLQAITDSAIAVAEEAHGDADSLTTEIAERDTVIQELQEATEVIAIRRDSAETENAAEFKRLTDGEDKATVVEQSSPAAEPWIRLTFRLREENSLFAQEAASLRASIAQFERTVVDFEERDRNRLVEINSWQFTAQTQQSRADSLHTIVLNIPQGPPKEKFLFFSLPSRKTSFIVGTVVGVIGFVIFDKYIAGGK